jgi:hypothetical protein
MVKQRVYKNNNCFIYREKGSTGLYREKVDPIETDQVG